jgi:hypothetical protein
MGGCNRKVPTSMQKSTEEGSQGGGSSVGVVVGDGMSVAGNKTGTDGEGIAKAGDGEAVIT